LVVSCALKDCNMSLPIGHLFCLKHAREAIQNLSAQGLLRPIEDLTPFLKKRFFKSDDDSPKTESSPPAPAE